MKKINFIRYYPSISYTIISFTVISCTMISSFYSQAYALQNTLEHAFTKGKFKGLLRYSGQYRNSNLHLLQDSSSTDTSDEKKQQYTAIGGYLGYETAPIYHSTIGATLYTSQPFGNNPSSRKGLGGLYEADGGQDAYTVLGEAYYKFYNQGHKIKIGRQEMPDYRFVSLSDIRMSPVTHSGGVYENTLIDGLKINLAYINKMKERNAKTFIDMARGARLSVSKNGKPIIRGTYKSSDYDADGSYIGEGKEMSMAGLAYNNKSLSAEAWNYFINDFVNTVYLYGQYNITPQNSDVALSFSAQYANQFDVGTHIAGNIDTWFYGLKAQAEVQDYTFSLGYNEVALNEKSYDGGTIFVRWGSPQMFNSFQVQDSELAGTKSFGGSVQYAFKHNSLFPGVVVRLRYADYNLPSDLNLIDARQNRTETTFDINYAFSKSSFIGAVPLNGLSVQFRLAYNQYDTNLDFELYRDIHGFDFDSVTDDFYDARLYFNYKF